MATSMCMDESSVDCLVLFHNEQDMKVSTKSVASEYLCHIPIKLMPLQRSAKHFWLPEQRFIFIFLQTIINNQTNQQIFNSFLII